MACVDSEYKLVFSNYSKFYGRAAFEFGSRRMPAGDYIVAVKANWGLFNETSSMDPDSYGSLIVDLYYPVSMGNPFFVTIDYTRGAYMLARSLRQIILDNLGSEACPDF